jgi:hypothetical protein
MPYHDGLRTIIAEKARHSSNIRAFPSDIFPPFHRCSFRRGANVDYFYRMGTVQKIILNEPSGFRFDNLLGLILTCTQPVVRSLFICIPLICRLMNYIQNIIN